MKPFRIQFIAHRLAAVVIVASVLAGCATRAEVALRDRALRAEARAAQLERQRDEVAAYALAQRKYIQELQRGMELQADITANLRENCSI